MSLGNDNGVCDGDGDGSDLAGAGDCWLAMVMDTAMEIGNGIIIDGCAAAMMCAIDTCMALHRCDGACRALKQTGI